MNPVGSQLSAPRSAIDARIGAAASEVQRGASRLVRRVGALTTMRAHGSRALAAVISAHICHVALARGDYAGAQTMYIEAIEELQLIGNRRHAADCLDGLAVILAARGEAALGAHLMGAAAAIRESIAVPLAPAERPIAEGRVAAVRAALHPDAFESTWQAGQAPGWEAAAEEALAAVRRRAGAPG
jgi:hypothetical protein